MRSGSLNYLLKNCKKLAQQIDSRAVADLAHHVLLRTLMRSMIWCGVQSGECTRDTQNYPSDRQGNWHFMEVSGTHHLGGRNIQIGLMSEETSHAAAAPQCVPKSTSVTLAVDEKTLLGRRHVITCRRYNVTKLCQLSFVNYNFKLCQL